MRQFIEMAPVFLFLVVYFPTKDIYIATAVLMGAICVQLAYEHWQDGAVSKRTKITFIVVMVAGAATIGFRDEMFIKWKPTIVNCLFAAALIASHYMGRENLLKAMLGEQIKIPDIAWRNLTLGWSAGFLLAAALNLVVAYGFSTDFWVAYKLIGGFGLTALYIAITVFYLIKAGHIDPQAEEAATVPAQTDADASRD